VVHNGLRDHRQSYKCNECGRRFTGVYCRDKSKVVTDYVEGKQTKEQLASRYGVSVRTKSRDLLGMRYVQKIVSKKDVSIQMDTTYWNRDLGLMVIKDILRNRILWRKYVTHETILDYMEGRSFLNSHGFRIYGVVTDGMRGLAQMLSPYPVQMCQFHQVLIVRRYLIRIPELEASRSLLDLVNGIAKKGSKSYASAFEDWYEKYREVLNERVQGKRIKRKTPPYMRPRLRSAYLSVKRNMKWLWTFEKYPETGLPRTNNALEGVFSDLKTKVRVHSGISRENRKRLLDEYIARHY
jgi:hypothetical protein